MRYRTKNINKWNLKYFETGEFQVIQERLHDLDREFGKGKSYNPHSDLIFESLDRSVPEDVRCVLVGQDPYPNPNHCTGIPFSIPATEQHYPPTLTNIFKEYSDDLGYPTPSSGNLDLWVKRGVFLWNVYPTVGRQKNNPHHWDEWLYLTEEVFKTLDNDRMVFVFLGRKAQSTAKYCSKSQRIMTSHPSPLGVNSGFFGSRIFSRVNALLDEPIDWRLPDADKITEKESTAEST